MFRNLVLNSDGSFTFTPSLNRIDPVTFTYQASDGTLISEPTSVSILITPVNDTPSFFKGADQTVFEDTGAQTVLNWATGIGAGPSDEANQALTFQVNNNNNAIFSVQPAVSPTGTLTYTPAANADGSATVTVSLTDNSGTDNGGVNMSAPQTLTINVTAVNDAPTLAAISNPGAILEDASLQTVNLSGISAGGGESQVLTVTASSSNTELIPNPSVTYTSPNAIGSLSYTPVANASGTATITVIVSDDGGTANGGIASVTNTFTVAVSAANDAPAGTDKTITINEDTSYTFTAADFGFSDPTDTSANAFLAVKITTLPSAGALTANGVAVSAGDFVSTDPPAGITWTAREINRYWNSVASSADGTKLVAGVDPGQIYTSTDSGVSWTARETNRSWDEFASSSDGTKLVALAGFGKIYTSTDSGATWTARESNRSWRSVASSADGTKLVAGVGAGQIYTSTDSGVSWTARMTDANRWWLSVASSADGTKLVAAANGGQIYTSTDSGVTWTARESNRDWITVASSADGTKLVAGVYFGQIYTSTDSGVTWTARESSRNWARIASSADGAKLVAVVYTGQIYTSSAEGTLVFTPAANTAGNASASFTFQVQDDGGTANNGVNLDSTPNTMTINVTAVNDAPTLAAISNPAAILEDAGLQTVNLTGIGAGGGESQALTVTASSSNTALLPNPTVTYTSPNATGSLSYTPVANASGTATITVIVTDDGGTANGGISAVTNTFTVTVTSLNDAPTLAAIGNPAAILEDAGLQTVNLSGISAGGGESQALTVTASSSNTSLIPNPTVTYTSPSATGSLSYTPVANASGMATITVIVTDDGGTANGGVDKATNTFSVTVAGVAGDPGDVDTGFNPNASITVYCTAVQADGKIVIGGGFIVVGGVTRNMIARLNADGTLDAGFNPNANSYVTSTALQADEKIVLAGGFTTVDGVTRNQIARLNADGTLDAGFNPDANGRVLGTVVQTDGKIIIGGDFTAVGGVTRNKIARLNGDGTLDPGFNPNANFEVYSIVVQADGKIVLGGEFNRVGAVTRNKIARLNADGSLDTGFDPNVDHGVYSTALQADGKIIIGGYFGTVGGVARNRLARLNTDGSVDTGFANPDANNTVGGTVVQADGKIVIGGGFTTLGGVTRNYIARLANDAATQSLSVPSASRVQWLRGGSSPESLLVTFELSTDGGSNYTLLGSGTRISGGWELAGLGLPASGQVRARARVTGGLYNGSSGLVETVAAFSGFAVPEIAVEQPTGANIADGGSKDFGSVVAGANANLTFAVKNTGTADLTGLGIAIDGADASLFTVTVSPVAPVSGPSGSTVFTMRFAPTSAGAKTAGLHIANNDSDEDPFDITLTGTGLGAPSITDIANQTFNEDASTGPLAFTIGDAETPVASLTLTKSSSNQTLVPDANIVLGGSGASRNVTVTPTGNQSGSATITVSVTDGDGLTASDTFTVTVDAVNDTPTISDISDQTTFENTPTGAIGFTVGDAETAAGSLIVTGASSNQALIPDANIVFGGGGSSRTVTITPASNQRGSATIIVTVSDGQAGASDQFVVNVTPIPITAPEIKTQPTDQTLVVGSTATFNVQATGGTPLRYQWQRFGTNLVNGGNLSGATLSVLTISNVQTNHAGNYHVIVSNIAGSVPSRDAVLTVLLPNKPPSFTKGSNVTVLEDAEPQTRSGWATKILSGPVGESPQPVTFLLANSNPGLFSAQPAIDPDGTLTFSAAANSNGVATVTVRLQDNGGTTNGGVDTSAPQSFTITVTPVNDAPSFTLSTDLVEAPEDAPKQTLTSFARNLSVGPPNESVQKPTFVVTNSNKALFAIQPAIDPSGTLTFRVATNATGSAVVTAVLRDNGGKTNGGDDTSDPQTFTVTVTPLNDPPFLKAQANRTLLEDRSTNVVLTVSDTDSDLNSVTVSATSSNPDLIPNPVPVTGSGPNPTLELTPLPDAYGKATITLVAEDDQASRTTNSFLLTVTGVNDPPSFELPVDLVTVVEDAPLQRLTAFALNILDGPLNETNQLTFVLTNSNKAFFTTANQPAIDTNGTLSFKLATNATGSVLVTAILQDNGGTANGGVNRSAPRTFTIIAEPANDPPVIKTLANRTLLEDRSTNVVLAVSDIDSDLANVTVSATSSNPDLIANPVPVTGTAPAPTLTLAPLPDAYGKATITVVAEDLEGGRTTNSFLLTVTGVNDPPSFELPGNLVTVLDDAPIQRLTGFALNILDGPPNETNQLTFVLTNSSKVLFATQPAIDTNGTLSFRPATNAIGSATLTVVLRDNGGTASGGVNQSPPQTFQIEVSNVNDPPALSGLPAKYSMFEDRSTNLNFTVKDLDGAAAAVQVTVSSSNPALFEDPVPVIGTGASRSITLQPLTDAVGTNTFTVVAADDQGGESTYRVVVTLKPVNDAPSFNLSTDTVVAVNALPTTIPNFAIDLNRGPVDELKQTLTFTVTSAAKTFYAVQPAISATGTLTFRLKTNSVGSNLLTVFLRDSGGTTAGGKNQSASQTFTIVRESAPAPNSPADTLVANHTSPVEPASPDEGLAPSDTEKSGAPILRAIRYAGTVRLSVGTAAGRIYVLEFKNSLAEREWKSITSIAGDGSDKELSDSAPPSSSRFYRVRVESQR